MVGVMLRAFWGGLYTPRWGVEMGLCTHLEFQDRYSYGLWALDIFEVCIWACPGDPFLARPSSSASSARPTR